MHLATRGRARALGCIVAITLMQSKGPVCYRSTIVGQMELTSRKH